MVALYIIFGVILFIFIVLHFFIAAEIAAEKDKLDIKVKFLFFTLYPKKEKDKNKKAKKRKYKSKRKKLEHELEEEKKALENAIAQAAAKTENESAEAFANEVKEEYNKERQKQNKPEKQNEGSSKKSFCEKLEQFKDIWKKIKLYSPIAKKALKRLVKAIRIYDVDIFLAVANDDAYECAMKYGKINIIVYNVITLISLIFRVKVKRVFIESRFNSSKGDYSLKLTVKVRPSTLIAIGFCGLVNFLYVTLKHRKELKKIKETELQKT
ncbi:MAG: hypothetical protein WC900_09555 [Oscillospiraceae bacterium]|jgi:Skp family chaperone for outer membrane proteins